MQQIPRAHREVVHLARQHLTGAVCPLYWYTDTYLCNTHVQGLLSGPLGAQYLMGAQVEK